MAEQEQGALRVSHEDRDQVAEALRVAAGDGRLTADELDQRLELALSARTYADLEPLLADLPGAGGTLATVGVYAPAAAAKDLVTLNCSSSSRERTGRWTVPARINVRAHAGTVKLDFTEAVLTQPALQVDVDLHSSALTLITRRGIVVDTDEVETHSSTVKVVPWDDEEPARLRVTVTGKCHASSINARPPRAPRPPRRPRRSFWQWLRRAPRPRAITS
jgi:Domain of unknown function (DUF1707)